MAKTALATVKTEQHFQGPIPPPDLIAQYERVAPGFAERILTMAEREATARQENERRNTEIADRDIREARVETRRGQWMSFAITIAAFLTAAYCAAISQPWVAGVVAGTTLVSVVSTFLRRTSK